MRTWDGRAAPQAPLRLQCPACKGDGGTVCETRGISTAGRVAVLPLRGRCSYCLGRGNLPAQRAMWAATGLRMRAERLARGETVYQRGKRSGRTILQVLAAEEGRQDPAWMMEEMANGPADDSD